MHVNVSCDAVIQLNRVSDRWFATASRTADPLRLRVQCFPREWIHHLGARCQEGDVVNLDVSIFHQGVCDVARSSVSQNPSKLNHFNKWKRYDVANILRMISVLDSWIWHVYDRFKFMQIYAYPFWLIHAMPGSKWKPKLRGFHSDLNETFFIGECDEDSQRLVRTWTRKFRKIANSDVPRFMLCMCSLILEIDSLWLSNNLFCMNARRWSLCLVYRSQGDLQESIRRFMGIQIQIQPLIHVDLVSFRTAYSSLFAASQLIRPDERRVVGCRCWNRRNCRNPKVQVPFTVT